MKKKLLMQSLSSSSSSPASDQQHDTMMAHGLLCPRCKVSMASIPALLLHQGECAVRPHTPDLREKFDMQRDQFHQLYNEARSIHSQLHEASVAAAVAQDTAAQWREIAAQKERDNADALIEMVAAATATPDDTPEPSSSSSSSSSSASCCYPVANREQEGDHEEQEEEEEEEGNHTNSKQKKVQMIDVTIQTEVDLAMVQLREQCAQGTAELEAQIQQMNRLTQSLQVRARVCVSLSMYCLLYTSPSPRDRG